MNNITKKHFLSKFGKTCFNLALSTSALSATAATQSYYRSRDTHKGNGTYLADLNLSPFFAVNFEDNQLALNSGLDSNQGLLQHKSFHTETGIRVKELLIIDADVQNKSVFLAQQRPGVEVVEIKEGGLSRLMEVLGSYHNLDALHLVSHAQPGAIQLGGEVVSAETFQESVAAFTSINQAIKPGGDLLFYGCELAKGKQGEDFVTIIKGNTHVDIAASDDPTGNINYEGDWDLEIQQGNIDATPINESMAMKDFTGVLQFSGNFTLNNTNNNTNMGYYLDSADDPTFDVGGYTLTFDAATVGAEATMFNVYVNYTETAVTLSFDGGTPFDISALEVYKTSYASGLILTNNLGEMVSTGAIADFTGVNIDLSSFSQGITSVTITPDSSIGTDFYPDLISINLSVPSATLSSSNFDFNTFNIYPNPATDKVSFTKEVDRAIIYNMSGQQVGSYDNVKDIDMTALQPGLYYIAIEIEGSSITRKLVKK